MGSVLVANIQILRFVAALLVVLFHVALTAANEGRPSMLIASFGNWGESGVDIFFVISGFVMVLSQARGKRTTGRFLAERALRILPMYWLLTVALAGLLFFFPTLFNSDTFSVTKTLSSLMLVNWASGDGLPVLYLGWTLEYEWLFYIIFAISISLISLELIWLPVLVFFLTMNATGGIELVALEFIFGMFIGMLYIRGGKPTWPAALAVLGVIGLLGLALMPATTLPRHLAYGVPAMLIVAGLVWMPQFNSKIGLLLGSASYSIYLVQVFTIPLAFRVVRKIPAIPNDVAAILVVAISIAVGVLVYKLVEQPMTRFLNRRHSRPVNAMVAA